MLRKEYTAKGEGNYLDGFICIYAKCSISFLDLCWEWNRVDKSKSLWKKKRCTKKEIDW